MASTMKGKWTPSHSFRAVPDGHRLCTACRGRGRLIAPHHTSTYYRCPDCEGMGTIPCPAPLPEHFAETARKWRQMKEDMST